MEILMPTMKPKVNHRHWGLISSLCMLIAFYQLSHSATDTEVRDYVGTHKNIMMSSQFHCKVCEKNKG